MIYENWNFNKSFWKKLRKLSFTVFTEIQIIRDLQKKARNKPILLHRKFGIPTARVLKISNFDLISFSNKTRKNFGPKVGCKGIHFRIFEIKIYWYIFEDSVFITVSICLELRLWSFWPGYWWSFRHGVRGRWTFDCEAPGPPS